MQVFKQYANKKKLLFQQLKYVFFKVEICTYVIFNFADTVWAYTVPEAIDILRYNMKCSGENVILRGIVHVVSGFPLHFMFYRGNFDCFSNRVFSVGP